MLQSCYFCYVFLCLLSPPVFRSSPWRVFQYRNENATQANTFVRASAFLFRRSPFAFFCWLHAQATHTNTLTHTCMYVVHRILEMFPSLLITTTMMPLDLCEYFPNWEFIVHISWTNLFRSHWFARRGTPTKSNFCPQIQRNWMKKIAQT